MCGGANAQPPRPHVRVNRRYLATSIASVASRVRTSSLREAISSRTSPWAICAISPPPHVPRASQWVAELVRGREEHPTRYLWRAHAREEQAAVTCDEEHHPNKGRANGGEDNAGTRVRVASGPPLEAVRDCLPHEHEVERGDRDDPEVEGVV
eukprot:scaffold173461_cov28-Tisochrysis_lutea.AAC.2